MRHDLVVGETVTVRCDGPIHSVRVLRRQLEHAGLEVRFGAQGINANDPRWPGRHETGRWFQLVVHGPECEDSCAHVVSTWSEAGTLTIL